jgi:hypothetical protein
MLASRLTERAVLIKTVISSDSLQGRYLLPTSLNMSRNMLAESAGDELNSHCHCAFPPPQAQRSTSL